MFAEIVVNLPVEGTFHYHIPPALAGKLRIGHLVEVTFGRQKAQGVVVGFDLRAPVANTRPVEALVDRQPVVTTGQLALAGWMRDTYLTPLAECVRLFIPPGMSRRGDVLVTPVIPPDQIEPHDDTQARLLNLLDRRGPLRGRQIAHSLPRRNWRGAVDNLVQRGLLLRDPVLDAPSINPKQVRVVELTIRPAALEDAIAAHFDPANLPATRHAAAARRASILRLLADRRTVLEVGDVYATVPDSNLDDLRYLAREDLVALRREEVFRDPLADRTFIPDTPPTLTPHQLEAWENIQAALDASAPPPPILLHGVTGSGKTELYLRATEYVIERGKKAIILVPEIALTPQTVRRFGARFPGRLGLIHSGLSDGERYDTWRRARAGQYDVIVGPRSALFTPLDDLGLIVVDECHDDSYKQTPPIPPPYYHAVAAAVQMARLVGGLALLGSATPNVTTYARAQRPGSDKPGDFTLLELPARIMGHRQAIEAQAVHYHIDRPRYTHQPGHPDDAVMIDLPPVSIVDMRQELRAGNRSIFSRSLDAALQETIDRGEQAVLFLNRRGTATYVFCRACGYVLTCPHCDVPLTWHATRGRPEEGLLVCHHCNHRAEHPAECPNCGSDQIKFFGGGTERVESEVRERYPAARLVRWDTDTTGGKDVHDALLQQFVDNEANVLVGTQMVAKGLDLPLVTLVGVISADTALYLPDYRSGERTFQLLTQVAGRAGRGLLGGQVILQTYDPEHYAIRAAAEHNFHRFFGQEIRYRRELDYPPFTRLARLEVRAPSSSEASSEAQRLFNILETRIEENKLGRTALIGPAPCFYPRENKLYRWHVIVRGPDPAAILGDLRSSQSLVIDVDPVSLL